ncbi:MAG TPA: SUMF1/EgtB/PvdO family nonheme iron enzyme [Nitrospiraceae bacterium]|nr:SUMF1/EgtB/PvdO family nonheme iron enzyme [Nitrospiraceae bacterium]
MARIAFAACLILLIGLAQEESIGAQDVARLQAGVVRVSSTRPGTGFIVRLESDAAYILTAAHVVAGDPNPKVEFFTNKHVLVPAEVLRGAEGDDEMRGLALLLVKGKQNLPTGVTALPLDGTRSFSEGEDIIVIGFPLGTGPWHVIKGSIGSSLASDIFFSPTVDTGNSGGPIIRQGKVIGIVMATESSGRGLTADRVQAYIVGFGITAQERRSSASMATESSPPPAATAKLEPRPMAQDREVTGKDGAPMVLIPAGEFWMGSPDGEGDKDEHPQHQVYLEAYYIDRFEVTVSRYSKFMQSTGRQAPEYWAQAKIGKYGNRPVVGVDWHDAEAYCRWATKRLPTEAEWEKAARGTDGRTYPWGNDASKSWLAKFGKGFTPHIYDEGLVPVESYEAGNSPYELHHMSGNVWEWTADWYDNQYYKNSSRKNPKGPSNGTSKVARGGSWHTESVGVRSANRLNLPETHSDGDIGFRCAQDSPK